MFNNLYFWEVDIGDLTPKLVCKWEFGIINE